MHKVNTDAWRTTEPVPYGMEQYSHEQVVISVPLPVDKEAAAKVRDQVVLAVGTGADITLTNSKTLTITPYAGVDGKSLLEKLTPITKGVTSKATRGEQIVWRLPTSTSAPANMDDKTKKHLAELLQGGYTLYVDPSTGVLTLSWVGGGLTNSGKDEVSKTLSSTEGTDISKVSVAPTIKELPAPSASK